MRKHFAKPALSRFEIRLNENIALSWKYYYDSQLINRYHFSHFVDSGIAEEDKGCYEYYSGLHTLNWSTSTEGNYGHWFNNHNTEYTDPNNVHTMTAWLSYVSVNEGAGVCFEGTSGGPSH